MLRFVESYTQPGTAILAGNTVHADKGFLQVYMPRFTGHLHYRIMVPCLPLTRKDVACPNPLTRPASFR
ncbi:unnamed protein product, partial [marine sediment metagenome]